MPAISVDTPIGRLGLIEAGGAISRLTWSAIEETEPTKLLQEAACQLTAYFAGKLHKFDIPLAPKGTEFEQQVYQQMSAIPFGETRSYGEIAKALNTYGQPVGRACGSNPIPVIIPCHRVLSATGLGGYSGRGGVEMKVVLLKHEDAYPFLL